MGARINAKEVHERRVRRVLGRHELESIIAHIVHHEIRDEFGPDDDVEAVDYKLTFEDETEGSLGDKVGTRCIVDVIEKLKVCETRNRFATEPVSKDNQENSNGTQAQD